MIERKRRKKQRKEGSKKKNKKTKKQKKQAMSLFKPNVLLGTAVIHNKFCQLNISVSWMNFELVVCYISSKRPVRAMISGFQIHRGEK